MLAATLGDSSHNFFLDDDSSLRGKQLATKLHQLSYAGVPSSKHGRERTG